MIEQLHFIRPLWFYAFIPLSILLWFLYQKIKNNQGGAWSNIIAQHLLSALSIKNHQKQSKFPFVTLIISSFLLIFALSGPSFQKYPNQTFKLKQTLFIVLDLSTSMNATDVKPSRLKRALFSIKYLLKKDFEDDVALIGFSAEPYLISPATNDKKTILSLIDGINTDILPTQGSQLNLTMKFVQQLINNRPKGINNILLLSDVEKISNAALETIKQLKKNNTKTSMINVASIVGSAIPKEDGVLKYNNKIIISKRNNKVSNQIVTNGGGILQNLDETPNAIDNFLTFKQQIFKKALEKQQDKTINSWMDSGIWLTLLLIPFSLISFRKGYLLVLPFIFFLPHNNLEASTWQDLWQTKNQQAQQQFLNKEYQKAITNFENPAWKASSFYKAKHYKQAQKLFSKLGHTYNEANALARLGQFKKAIKKYQQIKKNNPNYKNALYNIELLKKLSSKKKQQQKQQQKKKNKQNKKQQQSDKKSKKKEKLSDKEKEQLKKEGKRQKKDTKKKSKKKKKKSDKKSSKKEKPKKKPKKRTKEEVLNNEKRQQVDQELKKINTKPYGLLKRKFLIERAYRQKERSKFYNSNTQQQW
ncbi:TPR domain protein in aerotolerance operon [hydrothermal vent metagenome]|uniref:TPR domain protein in aerotolerance operon n=1 Tax=hydrothermal vent metagenome TaxID=652676 RepID=A0A1W1CDD8_9ZZZZ